MSQTTMQQVIITEPGGVDKLAYETVTIPEAKADEVLVKVHAFGINRPDILQRQGLYPMPPGVTQVPGLEVAGEVVAVGAEVTQFKLGDKVCGLTNGGGYAEYCVVPQSQTLHIPENVSFVEAAAIPETFFTDPAEAGARAYQLLVLGVCGDFGRHIVFHISLLLR